jgi:hypothetical protein
LTRTEYNAFVKGQSSYGLPFSSFSEKSAGTNLFQQ